MTLDQYKTVLATARALPSETQASFLERVSLLLRQHHRPGDAEVADALNSALSAIDDVPEVRPTAK
jgi:hypothetical protein